jgi:hypothetical protein
MDDEPFLSLSLKSFTNGAIRTEEIDTLERLTRAKFDADRIIDEARQRLLKEELIRSFGDELRSPSDELTRMFLQRANVMYVRKKAVEIRWMCPCEPRRAFLRQSKLQIVNCTCLAIANGGLHI